MYVFTLQIKHKLESEPRLARFAHLWEGDPLTTHAVKKLLTNILSRASEVGSPTEPGAHY